MIIDLKNKEFSDAGVDIEYSRYFNCESYGCDIEGICRCSKIEDIHIKSIDVPGLSETIYSDIYDNSLHTKRNNYINSLFGITKELDIYTIDRILRKSLIYDEDIWDIGKSDGYYGEEIDSVRLDSRYAYYLSIKIDEALSIDSVKERVEYLLNLEYGYILPELLNKDYKIVTIRKSDILFNNEKHLNSISNKNLSYYSDEEYGGIRGIVIEKGNKYKLIDGYHRCYKTKFENVLVLKAHL